jgi:aspartyl-tRNA(Asn)/glutamyl-tRNA(Gln) amidotransferase subunit C
MKISSKDVEYAAKLARLSLTEEEKVLYTEQLDNILVYMDELNSLDTSNVKPVFQAMEIKNVFRNDSARDSGLADDVMANAPDREGQFFRVKKVIE